MGHDTVNVDVEEFQEFLKLKSENARLKEQIKDLKKEINLLKNNPWINGPGEEIICRD